MLESDGPRVLIVDDDASIRAAHARMLERAGFSIELAEDGEEALSKVLLGVDLVVLDGDMPHMDGFEVARNIRANPDLAIVPLVMVTGLVGAAEQRRAMEAGINDFITKPVDAHLLEFRCRWLADIKRAHDRLDLENIDLREAVARQTQLLRDALSKMTEARRLIYDAHLDTIRRLTFAAEYKDHDTANHITRIGEYSQVIGRAIGMSTGEAERLSHAAPMHDVGKIGIPDSILLKPGSLDDAEWVVMRSHTTLGARLLSGSPSPILALGETIAMTHHERWDGTGYPNKLREEDIPVEGRICAVVDVFDALTMDRPYRKAVPRDEVLRMMEEASGAHFDPYVLRTFVKSLPDILEIQERLSPAELPSEA